MKRKIIGILLGAICAISVIATVINLNKNEYIGQESDSGEEVIIADTDVPLAPGGEIIYEQPCDLNVIPDKYNTGANEPENGFDTIPSSSNTINGLEFISNDDGYKLDMKYRNKTAEGEFVFENVDFGASFTDDNSGKITDRKIHLVFINCVFGAVSVPTKESGTSYEFIDCSLSDFSGSNATFERCHFSGSYNDAIRPFHDVIVRNCFISDLSYPNYTGKAYHTDGTQIYGVKGYAAKNISFENCRFEIPQLEKTASDTYVNACLMLQLEYADGENIHFNNCMLNGGGYTIYAWDKNKGYTFTDVSFSNITIGCLKKYGNVYHKVSSGVEIDYNTISDTNALYAASVFKDETSTYISVSNDTAEDRKFRVYTSSGNSYDFEIESCASVKSTTRKYDDYPFDRLFTVPEDCDWLVCYEITNDSNGAEVLTQFRFVNWTQSKAVLQMGSINGNSNNSSVILEGNCGAAVNFKLDNTGLLTLSGTGSTFNYTSKTVSPWHDYAEQISSIIIEEGITVLGNQLFRDCKNVVSIDIPEGVYRVSGNVFNSCRKLSDISIPLSMKKIDDYAFWGTKLKSISYSGDASDANEVKIGHFNDSTLKTYFSSLVSNMDDGNIYLEGTCGKSAYWTLSDKGTLHIFGEGATNNYNSAAPAPWYDKRNSILAVVVDEGITSLGNQSFRKCSNLENVSLPNGLSKLGTNCFIGCKKLQEIIIPKDVKRIGKACFKSDPLKTVYFDGTKKEWSKITIDTGNTVLKSSSIKCLLDSEAITK